MNPPRRISLVRMMGSLMNSRSRLLRVGTLVMEENFALMAMRMLALTSQSLCKLLRDCLLQHSPLPLKLLFIGSPISRIGRGADGAFLPSGRTRLTSDFRTIPERFLCLLLTTALSEIRVTMIWSLFLLENSILPEPWSLSPATLVVLMIMPLGDWSDFFETVVSIGWCTCLTKRIHWVR